MRTAWQAAPVSWRAATEQASAGKRFASFPAKFLLPFVLLYRQLDFRIERHFRVVMRITALALGEDAPYFGPLRRLPS